MGQHLRAGAKKPIKSRKTGAKLYASTASRPPVARLSSPRDSCQLLPTVGLWLTLQRLRKAPVSMTVRKLPLGKLPFCVGIADITELGIMESASEKRLSDANFIFAWVLLLIAVFGNDTKRFAFPFCYLLSQTRLSLPGLWNGLLPICS